jgi:hypothetical protein
MPKTSPSDSPDSCLMLRKHASPFATFNMCMICDIQSVQPNTRPKGHISAMKMSVSLPSVVEMTTAECQSERRQRQRNWRHAPQVRDNLRTFHGSKPRRCFNSVRKVGKFQAGIYPGKYPGN